MEQRVRHVDVQPPARATERQGPPTEPSSELLQQALGWGEVAREARAGLSGQNDAEKELWLRRNVSGQ